MSRSELAGRPMFHGLAVLRFRLQAFVPKGVADAMMPANQPGTWRSLRHGKVPWRQAEIQQLARTVLESLPEVAK
eukprot:12354436-Alexandrium_andersonii.AAC.1